MTRVPLSDTSDYGLVNESQDIRGYSVVDGNGQPVGTVESMLIDTDAELVTTLVLEDGTEIAVADVTLGDNVVYVGATAASAAGRDVGTSDPDSARSGVTVFDDGGRVVRRERVEGQTADSTQHDADFQTHHEATYGASGRGYDQTQAAYQYGYSSAHGDANRNRTYADAETDLRSGYTAGDFDADREAVRHGYGRAQKAAR